MPFLGNFCQRFLWSDEEREGQAVVRIRIQVKKMEVISVRAATNDVFSSLVSPLIIFLNHR